MAHVYDGISDDLAGFLARQPVFFVATAPSGDGGHLNLSPKGLAGSFAVLDPDTVAYLDLTGSGVETIAHLRENGRIVLMFCAFEGRPRIVRLHGRGSVAVPGDDGFAALAATFPPRAGIRSVVRVAVERVADSCGFGVPVMSYQGDRDQLLRWAEGRGDEGLEALPGGEERPQHRRPTRAGPDAGARGIAGFPGRFSKVPGYNPGHVRPGTAGAYFAPGPPSPWDEPGRSHRPEPEPRPGGRNNSCSDSSRRCRTTTRWRPPPRWRPASPRPSRHWTAGC